MKSEKQQTETGQRISESDGCLNAARTLHPSPRQHLAPPHGKDSGSSGILSSAWGCLLCRGPSLQPEESLKADSLSSPPSVPAHNAASLLLLLLPSETENFITSVRKSNLRKQGNSSEHPSLVKEPIFEYNFANLL